jgi:hypothetical protein
MRVRCTLLGAVLLVASRAAAADAPEVSATPTLEYASVQLTLYNLDRQPGAADAKVRGLWAKGLRLEANRRLLESANVYERITAELPGDPEAYWRTSRNYWRHGEDLTDDTARVAYFELADKWASAGLDVDPDCGECCLYKFMGMAGLATTRGIFTAVRHARGMARLLDRGIALRPTHADNPWNTTLGNLYVAASHFYRVTPEWFFLKWIIGFRGDRRMALEYARNAYATADVRIDYTVALGAALLCVGTDKGEPELVEEGIAVLGRVQHLPHLRINEDPEYVEQTAMLLANPGSACSYTPGGWVDVNDALARADR